MFNLLKPFHKSFRNLTDTGFHFCTARLFFTCVQFVVHEAPGQELELDLFDEDTDKDDFIGQ